MGLVIQPETLYGRELAKWDRPRNQFVEDENGKREYGMNAVGEEPYPKMLYKAQRRENGKVMVMDMDALYALDPAVQARADAFNRSCQLTVQSEDEYRRAKDQGWRESPEIALAYYEALQQDIARAAAEANFDLQRMSEQAKREHAALDATTDAPVTDVPAPKRKPGRPKAAA